MTYGSEKFQYAHLNLMVSFTCRNVKCLYADRPSTKSLIAIFMK